jgi:hypothetical protein
MSKQKTQGKQINDKEHREKEVYGNTRKTLSTLCDP